MSVSIGKALLERSAVSAKIQDIITRVTNNATTMADKDGMPVATAEDPKELFNELGILETRHEQISSAIINANYNTTIRYEDKDCKIIDIIEKIEALSKRIKRIKDLIASIESGTITKPTKRGYSYGETNDKVVSVIDVANLRKMNEKLSHNKNKLQVVLQEANWSSQITI
jgi:hypothetical protein